MQYILTEDEFEDLKSKARRMSAAATKKINDLCMEVAMHKPVRLPWNDEESPKVPWGCIHRKEPPHMEHCDGCPVREICTLDKNYSK